MATGIEQIVEQSVEQVVGGKAEVTQRGSSAPLLHWLINDAGSLTPPWWSTKRDLYLSKIWKQNNHLALAVYGAQAKLVGIPLRIRARNQNVVSHVDQAEAWNERLTLASDFGASLHSALSKFYEDLLTQDNGGFMEIIGGGEPDGPIIGPPTAVRHLDSQRCERKSDPIYPVHYYAADGKQYKIHWTRIVYMSQMPSARRDMLNVGYCAVSRSIEVAQTLFDITRFKQQRLGSLPANQMLIGKGIRGEEIMTAFRMAQEQQRNRGFSHYSATIAIGSENTDIDLNRIDLTHMEPFDEQTSTALGMAAIASAFGLDLSEIWMDQSRSGSQAETRIRNSRTRGKLPAQVSREMATQLNLKLLPPHLEAFFDFHDDEEDQQRANIRDIRGRSRERDLGSQALTVRAAREQMLRDSEITRETFVTMELEHGRLENGTPIFSIFYSKQPIHAEYANLGVADPLVVAANDYDAMIEAIDRAESDVYAAMAETTSTNKLIRLMEVDAALKALRQKYDENRPQPEPLAEAEEMDDEMQDEADDLFDPEDREETAEGPDAGTSSMGRPRRPGSQKGGGLWQSLRHILRT